MPANHNVPHTQEAKDKIRKAKQGVPLLKKRREPSVIEGVNHWKCPVCMEILPESYFYKSKRTWNGITNECKKCHSEVSLRTRDKVNARKLSREHMRRARINNPDKFRVREKLAARNKPKNAKTEARNILNQAIKSGKIIKPTNCSECGKIKRITAHHHDYSKPLEVKWLCYECHGKEHWEK